MQYLDFEKNVAELESKVSELRQLAPSDNDISIDLSDIKDGDSLNIEVDQTTYAAVKAAEARLEEN